MRGGRSEIRRDGKGHGGKALPPLGSPADSTPNAKKTKTSDILEIDRLLVTE